MDPHNFILQGHRLVLAALVAMFILAGCDGNDGATGPEGPPGTPGLGFVPVSYATALSISNISVSINSPPVINFTVTNEDGYPVGGLSASDLRFSLAKLMPGVYGSPSKWQSYIVTTETATVGPGAVGPNPTMVQATRESGGTLVDNLNGTYTYTFQTDVTSVVCPAPCTDADGNPLDLSYQPNLVHRLGIQTRGALPMVNGLYTFVPATGTEVFSGREIVKTETCNECHNQLELHDARIETGYCVTCHNPGSTDANSGNTVDFKVMIHKLHRGEFLPSVVGGGEYAIWGYNDTKHDYSTVVFPQDIRNCTKCHDGSDPDTPQGDAWQTPSIAGCGSCHDDVDFSDGTNHGPGVGPQTDATCLTCHNGDFAPTAAQAHTIPASAPRVASGKFQYNILAICGADLTTDPPEEPVCAPGTQPVVTFSVSDPTQAPGSGTHGYDNLYDVAGPTSADRDPEFASDGFGGASPDASLNILTAWNTRDYTNEGGSGTRPSRADSSSALTDAVDNTDGTFTITLDALPVMVDVPATIPLTGSGAIAIEGHPLGESDPVNAAGVFDITVPVKGEVAYFAITDTSPMARRVAVDIESKCDNCHDQLSLHGANRAENAQLCVLCHNPKGTDVGRRPKNGGVPDDTATLDGKREESIDLKRLIHAIHAGQKDDPATPAVEGHGFREKGIVVYGYSGPHDYSHVRFPGILSDCTTCHNAGTYELTGRWDTPSQSGILASTVLAAPTAANGSELITELDDQRVVETVISPTAAVCSACHDGAAAKWHMENSGTAQFDILLGDLYLYEDCATCHGPGRVADVKVVHGIE